MSFIRQQKDGVQCMYKREHQDILSALPFLLFYTKKKTMASTRFYTSVFLIIAFSHFLFVSTAPLERRIIGASKLLQGVKGKLFSGSGTYYQVGSGSCGEHDTDSELVVAVNKAQMENGKLSLCKHLLESTSHTCTCRFQDQTPITILNVTKWFPSLETKAQ